MGLGSVWHKIESSSEIWPEVKLPARPKSSTPRTCCVLDPGAPPPAVVGSPVSLFLRSVWSCCKSWCAPC